MMLGSVGSLPGFCRGMSSVEAVADGKERIFRAIVAIEGERALRTVGLLAMVSRTIVQPRSPVAAAPDQYSLYGWVWQRYPKKLASFHCVYHLLACGPWANPLAQPLRRSGSHELRALDLEGQRSAGSGRRLASADIEFVFARLHASNAICIHQAQLSRVDGKVDCLFLPFEEMDLFEPCECANGRSRLCLGNQVSLHRFIAVPITCILKLDAHFRSEERRVGK